MIDTNILLEETLYSRKTQALSESLVLSEIEQYTQIKERLKEVGMLLEKYRLKAVESSSLNLPLHFTSTQLIPIGEGVSGSYFLKNEAGENKYVIKPVCEEPGGVNNPKYFYNIIL